MATNTARELAALGHDVTVVAPYLDGCKEFDAHEPVRVVRFRGYCLGWFRFIPFAIASFVPMLCADRIIAINIAYGGILAWFLNLFRQKPYVTFAYAYEFLKFQRIRPAAALFRSVYRHSQAVVAISSYTRDRLVEFGALEEKIKIILPGATPAAAQSKEYVDSVREKYAIASNRIILGVGRFIARKGHVALVRAMPHIIERIPDAMLILIGQGPTLWRAVREARQLGVRDQVLFPGYVSDDELMALYEACDVFALPTGQGAQGQVEGFGLVFTEAHAHGKPVVAGRSGGVLDAVLDNETGLLVEPEQPKALADAIISLMENPELAQRLGQAGRLRVERELNWTMFVRQVDALFEEKP